MAISNSICIDCQTITLKSVIETAIKIKPQSKFDKNNRRVTATQPHQLSEIHLKHVKELIHIFIFFTAFIFIIIIHGGEAELPKHKNFHHYTIQSTSSFIYSSITQ